MEVNHERKVYRNNSDSAPQLEFIRQDGFNHAPANVNALKRIRATTPLTVRIETNYTD